MVMKVSILLTQSREDILMIRMLKMFLIRFTVGILLVFLTYNNFSMISYYHWVFETSFEGFDTVVGAAKVVVGVILLTTYFVLFRGVYRGKGLLGIAVTILVMAAVLYMLQVSELVDITKVNTAVIVVQVVMAFIIGLGSMASIIWRRLFGQYHTEDPDT